MSWVGYVRVGGRLTSHDPSTFHTPFFRNCWMTLRSKLRCWRGPMAFSVEAQGGPEWWNTLQTGAKRSNRWAINKGAPGCLGMFRIYVGYYYTTQLYWGFYNSIINHHKGPYYAKIVFFRGSGHGSEIGIATNSGTKNVGWRICIFVTFTPNLGEYSHCDEHIFQMGGWTTNKNSSLRKLLLREPPGEGWFFGVLHEYVDVCPRWTR